MAASRRARPSSSSRPARGTGTSGHPSAGTPAELSRSPGAAGGDIVRWLASTALGQRDLVSPREWVRLLGGEDLAPVPPTAGRPVDVALFRFGDLPDRAALPPLDAHYVSFTVRGALLIERDLGDDADRARFRPGDVADPAGRSARTRGAGTPGPTSCTCTWRRGGWRRWPAGSAAPRRAHRRGSRSRTGCCGRWRRRC